MIFFDQFEVPTIKFGKCFAEFMIPIALLKKFGSYEFVTIIEVSNMRRCSGVCSTVSSMLSGLDTRFLGLNTLGTK